MYRTFCCALVLSACNVSYEPDRNLSDRETEGDKVWNAANDPFIFHADYEYTLANLPKTGSASQIPWASSYWPYYEDNINAPIHTGAPQDLNSPAEKYAKAFNRPDVPRLVSEDKGVLAMKARGAKACTKANESTTCTNGDVCAIREGESGGYCTPTWWGICHAWAPAAVLVPEPKKSVTRNGITFDPTDIKALVSLSYDDGLYDRFLSGRCNIDDNTGTGVPLDEMGIPVPDECEDTNAGTFHVVAANELGLRHRAFVEDRTYDDQVWNQPVRDFNVSKLVEVSEATAQSLVGGSGSEYTLNTTAVKFYEVTTTLRYISESSSRTMGYLGGNIDHYTYSDTYRYVLEVDAAGKIVGGEWIGTSKENHPDFLWKPEHKFPAVTAGIQWSDVESMLKESTDTAADTDTGGFDWGGTCDTGDGEFKQYIALGATTTVGTIPAGKSNVMIWLNAGDIDVDVQVWAGSKAIIRWASTPSQHGLLHGPTQESVTYNGVKYTYSGYNGHEGKKGDEYILIQGTTNEPLTMKAFGYQAGTAPVNYSYEAPRGCVDSGNGTFNQPIAHQAIVDVGTIPTGKKNLRIELTAAEDVDIQLYDIAENKAIVRWAYNPSEHGLLNGSGRASVTYKGMVITYSGYNGDGTGLGHEYITVEGEVSTDLKMSAFGYAAGTAYVEYAWGMDAGDLGDALNL